MVDKLQLMGMMAEGVANYAGADTLVKLHPARIVMTSPLARIAGYSIIILVVGYTTGVLFEKVFPNLPSFRKNILGIRRKKKHGSKVNGKAETLVQETLEMHMMSPSKRAKALRRRPEPAEPNTPAANAQAESIQAANIEHAEVPFYPLPNFVGTVSQVWFSVWKRVNWN